MSDSFDVLIIGAGPAGLAAAIAAKARGLSYLVLEKGALVNSLLHYPSDMVFFTTPELMEIGDLPFVSPHEKPNRLEALRYYRRATDRYALDVRLGEPVTGLAHGADGKFQVVSQPVAGEPTSRLATYVVVASGAYDLPNRLGVRGEDLPHVSHYYPEAHVHYRQRVVIVGGKNSAAETALELFRAGASVTLVHRHATLGDTIKYWVRPDIDNRIKEGSIAARFETRVVEITRSAVVVEGTDGREEIAADAVFLLTGYRPDVDLMRRAGIRCDEETLAPDLNPDTYETNVPNLFIAGGAIAGRNTGSIFIENGRFHGALIIKTLAERLRSD